MRTVGVPDDDDQLGWWVNEVIRRWAANGLPAVRRLDLLAGLLARLTLAWTTTGTLTTSSA